MPSPVTPLQLDQLAQAWATYQLARRRVWSLAPHAERRYLRTQDAAQYTVDCRRILSITNAAVGSWRASVRKILGRTARVEVVGDARGGCPSCFLVRVPKAGSIAMEELTFGRPHAGDHEALERLAMLAHRDRAERRERAAQAAREVRYAKMVAALAAHRRHAALKERALVERAVLGGVRVPKAGVLTAEDRAHNERGLALTRESYHHGREALRKLRMAHGHRDWLKKQGLVYDLTRIDTPIQL